MKPAISVGIESPEAGDLRSVALVAMLGLLSLAAVLAAARREGRRTERPGGREARRVGPHECGKREGAWVWQLFEKLGLHRPMWAAHKPFRQPAAQVAKAPLPDPVARDPAAGKGYGSEQLSELQLQEERFLDLYLEGKLEVDRYKPGCKV